MRLTITLVFVVEGLYLFIETDVRTLLAREYIKNFRNEFFLTNDFVKKKRENFGRTLKESFLVIHENDRYLSLARQ